MRTSLVLSLHALRSMYDGYRNRIIWIITLHVSHTQWCNHLLLLLLLHRLHRSHLLHDLLLLNQEGTQNARPSTTTPNNLPVMDALVAQITTISTGHRALRSGNSSHVSRGDAGKLEMIILDASPTPARGFLQQPHFIGLTIFLLY